MGANQTGEQLVSEIERLRQENDALRLAAYTSNENLLTSALDAVPALISFVDRNGVYRFNNKRYEEWFGIGRADLRGRAVIDVIGEKAYETTTKYVDLAIKGEQATHRNVLTKSNGDTCIVETSFVPHFGTAGDYEGYFVLVMDVTERAAKEQALAESEKHYRELVEGSQFGIQISKPDGQHIFVNEQFVELFGYASAAEILAIPEPDALVAPHDRQRLGDERAARRCGEPVPDIYEYDGLRKDGTIIPLQTFFRHIRWDGVEAEQRIIIDISSRRLAERLVRENEEHYGRLLEVLPDGILVHALGQIVYANPAMADIFGYSSPEDLIGELVDDRIPPGQLERVRARRRQLEECQQTDLEEIRYLRFDGSEVPVERLAVRTNWKGQASTLLVVRNIAQREHAERELRESKERAEAANRAKSEFLAVMSHEIRTPMNGVIGMADVLANTELAPQQRDFVQTIKDSGNALLGLLNDILDLSKIEAGRLDLDETDFSIDELLDATNALWCHSAEAKGLKFSILNKVTDVDLVRGDRNRLRQVLNNLVGNAIKFTETGSIDIQVSSVSREGDEFELRFEIRDTGIGLWEEQRQRIFQPFSQADSSTTRRFGGTGLGLTICKNLVALLGGEVGVESKPGSGSTFWFTILADRGSRNTAVEMIRDNENSDTAETVKDRLLHILVAEDNLINKQVISWILAPLNAQLDIVDNGIEAVSAVARSTYDLVLMDIQMPQMNGIEATREIRRLSGAAGRVTIIAITANAMAGDREQYLEAGMTDYVVKPVDPKMLFSAIERCTHRPTPEPEAFPLRDHCSAEAQCEETATELSSLMESLNNLLDGTNS
jgi:PAS domain S-box-containing protein